jgi:protein associated with RNAse G/E
MTRPGASYVAPTNQLGLVPAPGPAESRGWLATFHDVGGPLRIYVDITSPPVWDDRVVRAIDLDLDVICGPTGRVWIDDEDEFADHRVRFGYPDDVARGAMRSCDLVHAQVLDGRPPYDGDSAEAWLVRLGDLLAP